MLVDTLLAEAVRQGRLTPPVLGTAGEPLSPVPIASLEMLLAESADDRRDRCSISARRSSSRTFSPPLVR